MASKRSDRARRERQARVEAERQAESTRRQGAWVRGASIAIVSLLTVALIAWALIPALTSGGDAEPSDATGTPTQDQESLIEASGWGASPEPPDPAYAEDRIWTATLSTSAGDIVLELDGVHAPQAVASFVKLAEDGFFTGTECHRLTTAGIYVLQCGDPLGNGTGGPSYRYGPVENAPEDGLYPAGTLAMARVGGDPNSMGSQFFIVYDDSTIPADGAGGYTVFGQVVEGLSIVEGVASAGTITGQSDGRPAQSVIVNEVSLS